MRKLVAYFAVAAGLFMTPGLAAAAEAKLGPVEAKNVTTGKAALDPALSYIFIQAPNRIFGTFLRVPDEATRAEYQKDWEEAFEKAKKKHIGAMRSWQSQVDIAKRTKSKVLEAPTEPTRETFRIESIDLRDQVSFGPMFVFDKSETRYTYLNAVKPGTYIYYGMMMVGPAVPAAGSCNCMGTVKFEVKPGMVTDLGNFLYAGPQPAPPYDYATIEGTRRAEERKAKGKSELFPTQQVAFGLPETLTWPSARAEFHAGGKLNNYYGLPITRLAPIPGVLGYRRDKVIDLRTGTEVESPTIYTQGKIKK